MFREFEDLGFTNNTLFIILGNHGLSLGEHGIYGNKENFFETAFRVPLIMYSGHPKWPSVNVILKFSLLQTVTFLISMSYPLC